MSNNSIKVGAKIEVLWMIADETNPDPEAIEEIWWPAVVAEALDDEDDLALVDSNGETDGESYQAYILDYEEFNEFPAEKRKVLFVNQQELHDVEDSQTQKWKFAPSK